MIIDESQAVGDAEKEEGTKEEDQDWFASPLYE